MKALKVNKFKVGDKVRSLVDYNNLLTTGKVYTVICVEDCLVWVESDTGGFDYFFPQKFELFAEGVEAQTYNPLATQKSIKSDGGSSEYYFTKLPQELIDQIVKTGGIEIKDIARYVYDNNADAFNIIKAQKRIIEANKGVGKAGITKLYDAKKISFFANEQYEAIKREGTNG